MLPKARKHKNTTFYLVMRLARTWLIVCAVLGLIIVGLVLFINQGNMRWRHTLREVLLRDAQVVPAVQSSEVEKTLFYCNPSVKLKFQYGDHMNIDTDTYDNLLHVKMLEKARQPYQLYYYFSVDKPQVTHDQLLREVMEGFRVAVNPLALDDVGYIMGQPAAACSFMLNDTEALRGCAVVAVAENWSLVSICITGDDKQGDALTEWSRMLSSMEIIP